jgi:DNA-binding NtrC family response regulator
LKNRYAFLFHFALLAALRETPFQSSGWSLIERRGRRHEHGENNVPWFFMKTILLVDDEPDILTAVGEILAALGHKVIPQPDAESALSVIRQGTTVDLVITDLRMPGMSGIEFVTMLRKALPSVPVIMFTAYGDVETYLKSLSLGVFEYINKPVGKNELVRIVKAALTRLEANNSSPAS